MERLSTDEGYKELKKAAVNLLHTYNGYTAAINHLQNQQSHVAGINKEMIKCEDIQAAETLIIALGLKNVLDAIQKEWKGGGAGKFKLIRGFRYMNRCNAR